MMRRICEKVFDDAFRQFAGALILFEVDGDLEAGADILSFAVRHIQKSLWPSICVALSLVKNARRLISFAPRVRMCGVIT